MQKGLRHKLKCWLSKNYRREADAIRAIEQTFALLPRCKANVIVTGPEYGEGEYRATVTMPAKDILSWVNRRIENGRWLYTDQLFLPLLQNWLANAPKTGSEQSLFPKVAYEVIEREIPGWVEAGKASVQCPLCDSDVQCLNKKKTDEQGTGGSLYSWVDNWRCQAGHLLYRRNEWMHINRASHRIDTRNW